jgi:hypothetical protein
MSTRAWTVAKPPLLESTAAAIETLHGGVLDLQLKRKWPPVVVPTGEPIVAE